MDRICKTCDWYQQEQGGMCDLKKDVKRVNDVCEKHRTPSETIVGALDQFPFDEILPLITEWLGDKGYGVFEAQDQCNRCNLWTKPTSGYSFYGFCKLKLMTSDGKPGKGCPRHKEEGNG